MAEENNKKSPEKLARISRRNKLEAEYYDLSSRITEDGRIVFKEAIEIFQDIELPQFARPGTKAYAAKDIDSENEYLAVICGNNNIPRTTIIGSYKNIKVKNILNLVNAGVVDWPLDGEQRFALIFEKPLGNKIISSQEDDPKKIQEDYIISSVIEPVVKVLGKLKNVDLVHGAICLENMFMVGAEGLTTVMVGECLSSSASYYQHPFYEMVTRAMAGGIGRGVGTDKDDLYALGMCVIMLAKGKNLLADKSEEEIIAAKIKYGSYGAVVGKDRLPGGISEFLRGVLADDIEQRWDVDDVTQWIEGRRLTPKQPAIVLGASRPYLFEDCEYMELRPIVAAFSKHISSAAAELDKDQFILWVKRNFDDKALRDRFEAAMEREKSFSSERIVSAVCAALDPFAPIRYKELVFFPAGFGALLGKAIYDGEDVQVYAEVIIYQIAIHWVSQIFEETFDAAGLTAIFEKSRAALNQRIMGYGIERVLYIVNHEIYCMSPVFKKHYVLVASSLLLALEDISSSVDLSTQIFDRHMVAFISIREPNIIDPYLGHINSVDSSRKVKGILRTLAGIQRRFGIGSVPGVSKWIVSQLQPAIESFRDKDLRQEVIRQVNIAQNGGNLTDLVNLVDDNWVVQEDNNRFQKAVNEYAILEREKQTITLYLKKKRNFGRATGRQISMIVSSVLSFIIISMYSFIHFFSGL